MFLVFGVTKTNAYPHKHSDSCVTTVGKKYTIDLGKWTIFTYLTTREKMKKAIKETLLMNESFLFLLFHKIFLSQLDCGRRFVITF